MITTEALGQYIPVSCSRDASKKVEKPRTNKSRGFLLRQVTYKTTVHILYRQTVKGDESMKTAVAYLGAIGIGATSPQLFRASDGRAYVVKLQNNRLGPKVLANELLGAKLGEYLGLCFPQSGVIKIEEALIDKSRRLSAASVTPGRHFACQYLSDTDYVHRYNLPRASNIQDMAGVILFDHLLHNLDRTFNRKNLLIRRETTGYRIYAIDNSHLFRRGRWTAEGLDKLATKVKINSYSIYGILLKHYLSPVNFAPFLAKVQQLSDHSLTEMVESIPGEWLPHEVERRALINFLIARRDMANTIVDCLSALIPNNHRRTDVDQVK